MDVADRRIAQCLEGVADDVGADEFGRRLRQDTRHVERDIAVADHDVRLDVLPVIETGHFGIAALTPYQGTRPYVPGHAVACYAPRTVGETTACCAQRAVQ